MNKRGNKVQKLLKEWQHRLALDDWYLVLRTDCSPNDMELKEVQGETNWDEVNKCAIIRIINEKDYGDRILPMDKEKVLVYELLHIKFWLIQGNDCDLQNRYVHHLIDEMAVALVDAKRSGNGGSKL